MGIRDLLKRHDGIPLLLLSAVLAGLFATQIWSWDLWWHLATDI